MTEDRIEQFKTDVTSMKLKTGGGRKDGLVSVVGIVLMIVGIVAAFIVYQSSTSQSDPRNIQSQIILSIAFLALSVLGAAMFLFAALARFLRIWLLRQMYEGQEHIERVVTALRRDA